MLQLDDIKTQNAYPAGDNNPAGSLTDQQADLLELDVGVADCYVQLRRYDEERRNLLGWGDDIRVTAPGHRIYNGVAGVRVKSADPGSPASVTAQLFQPDDVRPSAASAAVQVVTTVGQVGVQHNDALIASENTLDLDDSAQILWSVTDDGGSSRVKISAVVAASVALTGAPTAPTPGTADNTTRLATTAYVKAQGYVTAAYTGEFDLTGAAGGFAFTVRATGDTQPRLGITGGGNLDFGPGNAAVDTTLSRVSAGVLQLNADPATADNSHALATTAYVKAQGYVTAATAPVTSVFGRAGSVVATTGDYTAAQVTNAFNLAAATTAYNGELDQTVAAGAFAFTVRATGDTQPRTGITGGGNLNFGPGNAAVDTTLSRVSAGVLQLNADPATADNSHALATTAYVKAQGYVTAATAPVTSVFGRPGAVVATTGDYTAAQVTNAFNLAAATTAYNGELDQTVAAGGFAFTVRATGDTQPRIGITGGGNLDFGPGNAAVDTTLARSGVAALALTGSLTASGALISTGQAGGVGYATGAGSAVTQATSKSTGVTINRVTGTITMNGAALAAGASVVFQVNNSTVNGTDTVEVNAVNFANYRVEIAQVLPTISHAFQVRVTNVSGGSLSEAVNLQFNVHKGANS